jgi:hypothetical protein
LLKIVGSVPEKEGLQIVSKPSVLLSPPGRDFVSSLYDKFHADSGTISRKEFIANSAHPFEAGSVSHAVGQMEDALLALRDGTLTRQQAVNASQAGRIISDAKGQGQELAMQMAETAGHTKQLMDNFIQNDIGPSVRSVTDALTGWTKDIPIPSQPGYPEWQAARDAANKQNLYESISDVLPQNRGNSTNVLRPWHGATAGGAAGGAFLGGPLGAAIGGAIGFASTSPIVYRTALQGAAIAGKVLPTVYRVGAPVAAGAAGSALQQAYMAQPR